MVEAKVDLSSHAFLETIRPEANGNRTQSNILQIARGGSLMGSHRPRSSSRLIQDEGDPEATLLLTVIDVPFRFSDFFR
jgi:hypothetical protein